MSKKNKVNLSDYALVYSTDPLVEKKCSACGLIMSLCKCRQPQKKSSIVLKPVVRIEKKGRGGKMVTVISRLPIDQKLLLELCAHLKRKLGSGGTSYLENAEGVIEIQGDWRDTIAALAQSFLEKAR